MLLAGGLALRFRSPPAETAPTAAPVTLPTAFTREPDPCAFLSAGQAAELTVETTPRRRGDDTCRWSPDSGQPRNLSYSLEISAFRLSSDEAARRTYARFLKQERERTTTQAGMPLTVVRPAAAVPGIGSEAYAVEGTNTLTHYSSVVFRAANLVIAVQYQRGTGEDADGSTREGADTVTRWVLEKLSGAR